MMTIVFILVIILGIVTGISIFPQNLTQNVSVYIDIALYITLFSVGISIGLNKKLLSNLKKMGLKIVLLPIGTIIGSLLGGLIAGLILSKAINVSLSIAAGFGWYSLSAGLLTDLIGPEIGAISFISNVSRELLAFILIPFVAKFNPYSAISIGGATTMDTTLPLVTRNTNENFAVVSFIHGAILSLLVPILVSFFANL